jgi:hypothetical protein
VKFTNPWIDPRVQSVRVTDAQAYLLRHGWKPKSFARPQVLLFEGPPADDGEPITQIVPTFERGSDYLQCIIDLITNLALLEDRPAAEVLNDMLQQAPPSQPPLPSEQDGAHPNTAASGLTKSEAAF